MVTAIRLSDEEIELTLLAVEYFIRHGLTAYDDEDRPGIAKELSTLVRKLRDA